MGNWPPKDDEENARESQRRGSQAPREQAKEERGDIRIVSSGSIGRRDKMEDTVAIQTHLSSNVIGVALFDGHTNGDASIWAKENLFQIIAANESFKNGDLEKACTEAFYEADVKMRAAKIKGGTTALVVLITPQEYVIAHAGDSRAVLGRAGKATLLTVDHSPDEPGETERIVAAGGKVVKVRGVARVLAPKLSRIMLSVSRSLGDFALKDPKRPPNECVVTPRPDVFTHRHRSPDDYLVLACDGVWEVMNAAAVVEYLHRIDRPAPDRKGFGFPSSGRANAAPLRLWGHIRRGSAEAANYMLGSSTRGRTESWDMGRGTRVRFMSEDGRTDPSVAGHVPEQRARPPNPTAAEDLPFCYDGPLYTAVERPIPRVISRLPPEDPRSLPSVCDRLIDLAMDRGAYDNLSVVIIDLRNTIELPLNSGNNLSAGGSAASTAALSSDAGPHDNDHSHSPPLTSTLPGAFDGKGLPQPYHFAAGAADDGVAAAQPPPAHDQRQRPQRQEETATGAPTPAGNKVAAAGGGQRSRSLLGLEEYRLDQVLEHEERDGLSREPSGQKD